MPNIEPPTHTVVVERQLRHPPAKVWRALTEGALLERWMMKNDFRAEVGHRFTLRAEPRPPWDGVVHGEVTEVEPPKRLCYRWRVGDPGTGGFSTLVTWTLAPTPDGVLLRMEQSGFREDQQANLKGATYGWAKFLGGLEAALNTIT